MEDSAGRGTGLCALAQPEQRTRLFSRADLNEAFGSDAMQELFFPTGLRSSPTPPTFFYFMSGVGLGIVMTLALVTAIGL